MAANGLVVKRRIGLTGTLMQNRMEEMYTTLSWAVPGALGEKAQFKDDYENPIKLGNRINAKPEALARARLLALRLHKLIQKHVLRREKDMIKDQVPSKDDNIVICPMSEEQKAVYARVLSSEDYDLLRKAGDPCPCGQKEQSGKPILRKDCCYEWVKQDDLRMFYVDPKFADDQGYVKWHRFLLRGPHISAARRQHTALATSFPLRQIQPHEGRFYFPDLNACGRSGSEPYSSE